MTLPHATISSNASAVFRAVLSGLLLTVPAFSAAAATFHYEAYIAGVRVGTATVSVERDSNSYAIRGSAAARGVANIFSDWQSVFFAKGRFVGPRPELTEYGYDEQERRKRRILTLENGEVRETKNGKVRPPRPVLDGLDVLTAFFIEPDCWRSQLLHTGRSLYQAAGRTSRVAGGCLLDVEDEEGDRDRVHLVFAERDGLRIPVKLTTRGLIRGSIVLAASSEDTMPSLARSSRKSPRESLR